MPLKNTPERFGALHKTIHWATALIMCGLLCVGFYMADIGFSPQKLQLYFWHKSFGLLILFLVIARVAWKFSNPKVGHLHTHAKWERTLSMFIHVLLYGALFLMPLSGWLMSSAGDFPAPFFGLFEMPDLIGKNESAFELLGGFHEILALIIMGAVGLHMAGAFKHHFIDRDETLQRMTTGKLGLVGGALFVVLGGLFIGLPGLVYLKNELAEEARTEQVADEAQAVVQADAPASVQAGNWVIDKAASTLGFEATQYGTAFSGQFKMFDGTIDFDPADLSKAYARIVIDISSINTGSDDRDGQARSADWFDAANHPQAVFETQSFVAKGADKEGINAYEAIGTLSIRGASVPVTVPFGLRIDDSGSGPRAKMDAVLSLNRLDFGIGQGQWQSTETIGNAVKINIHVEAAAAPSSAP